MARIVRTASGVVVDRQATISGRGAYVCYDPDCVATARRRLRHALRTPDADVKAVVRELEGVHQ
jgi:predicted RNA-binding protein YlxR (DUF448 family)